MCTQIAKFKPDVVVTEKGLSDLAIHFLTKAGISAIRRLRKTGVSMYKGATHKPALLVRDHMVLGGQNVVACDMASGGLHGRWDLVPLHACNMRTGLMRGTLSCADNNRIARATGATIVHRPEEIRESDIGTRAGLFDVRKIGDEFFTFIVDCEVGDFIDSGLLTSNCWLPHLTENTTCWPHVGECDKLCTGHL